MFVNVGHMLHDQRTFNPLTCKNASSWDNLIMGYIEHEDFEKALSVYDTMRKEPLHPRAHTLTALLRACAKLKDIESGCNIHLEASHQGLLKVDAFVGSALIDMYAKCGSLERALDVFKNLSHRSVVQWNALIAGYAKHGKAGVALQSFERMKLECICPDAITFTCSLKACGSLNAAKKGIALHAEIVPTGLLRKDSVLGSSIVDMYVKCGLLLKAQEVLDKLSVRTIGSWNALIGGYAKKALGQEALNCFEQMQLEGVFPNVITLLCVLKACGNLSVTNKGTELHAEIERQGVVEKDAVVGSALVDMYCKCGLLTKGQEVFERLSKRNVDSWNALITGYIQHDLHEAAVGCLQQMCLEGVIPDSISFACSLRACGFIGDINQGMHLHFKIARCNCMKENLSVGNALIDMYTKVCSFAKAREVFDGLPDKDIVSWNALLTGYVKHELYDEALNLHTQMQRQAIIPNAVTLASCLKACGGCGEVGKGLEIHMEAERNGLLDNVVGEALIEMYAKCGLVLKAQEVFDKLPRPDLESWNALILGYLYHDCGEQVLNKLQQMQRGNVLPDAITYAYSLKACGNIGFLDKGREIHAEVDRQGLLEQEIFVGISLVDMYIKFGLLTTAQEVFDTIVLCDMELWNTLIAGYVRHECAAEALHLFEEMRLEGFLPNAITFACGLKACGIIKDIEKGEELHMEVEKQGLLDSELIVGNSVVDMYFKCGLLAKAQEAFYNLPYRDIVSWNILITGYTNHNHNEEALTCLTSLQLEGVYPDAVTFACCLKACGSIKAADRAGGIHEEIERRGFLERDIVVAIALIDAYARCGVLTKVQEVFDRLPERDLTVWNVLITGYAKHESSEEVLYFYEKMHLEGICRDAITFACGLRACGTIGAIGKGRKIHLEIGKTCFLERDLLVGNGLIDMYCKGGHIVKAQEVFDTLLFRDIASWNTLIAGYAQLGESNNVFLILDRMEREGALPDNITFVIVLNACNHAGLVDSAEVCFNAMLNSYGFVPTVEHYTCMLDLLGRAGQLSKAAEVTRIFPGHPNVMMWCTVLGACKKWGNLELGKRAFKQAMYLDENETVAYVCMYNIYADFDERCSNDCG